MQQKELKEHIFLTYVTIRRGAAMVAFAFPPLLWLGGLIAGIGLQDSMSDYYHALAADGDSMRDWFVGILFTIGITLFLHKGYTTLENAVLNAAGILAVGIALIPTPLAGGAFSIHGTMAVLFFLCIGFVCVACASETLKHMQDEERAARYRRTYLWLGALMIASPAIGLLVNFVLQARAYIFFVELFGVWVFSVYWFVKSREIEAIRKESGLDVALTA